MLKCNADAMDHTESSPTKLRNFATCLARLPQVRRNLATLFGDNNQCSKLLRDERSAKQTSSIGTRIASNNEQNRNL
jgi:hypothetical protein